MLDDLLRNDLGAGRLSESFVGHLQEQQVSELFDVIAVAHPVVAQDVAADSVDTPRGSAPFIVGGRSRNVNTLRK
jgi:hypothetical protein